MKVLIEYDDAGRILDAAWYEDYTDDPGENRIVLDAADVPPHQQLPRYRVDTETGTLVGGNQPFEPPQSEEERLRRRLARLERILQAGPDGERTLADRVDDLEDRITALENA